MAVAVLVITMVVAVVDEVEVEVDDLITINKDHGSNHKHRNISGHILLTSILLEMHIGSNGPLLLVFVYNLQLAKTSGSNSSAWYFGSKKQQAHVAATQSSYAPTDIQDTMHTLSLSPLDKQWYMDIGATSHMTANKGNLTSYSNISNNITVSSGHNIPVIGCGNALIQKHQYPLTLCLA